MWGHRPGGSMRFVSARPSRAGAVGTTQLTWRAAVLALAALLAVGAQRRAPALLAQHPPPL
eukprot:715729-Rhodomonas_salina.2